MNNRTSLFTVAFLAVTAPVFAESTALVSETLKVDTASERLIQQTLANPEMLYDTSITWQRYQGFLGSFSVYPFQAEALYAELGLSSATISTTERAIRLYGNIQSARGKKGKIIYHDAGPQGKGNFDAQMQAETTRLGIEERAFEDSLSDVLVELSRQLTPTQSDGLSQWLRESNFLGNTIGAKVDEAFYGQTLSFGPGFNAAPDFLEDGWRQLVAAPAFCELVDRRTVEAIASLRVSRRLSKPDSTALSDVLRRYFVDLYRVRAELVVVNQTGPTLSGQFPGETSTEQFDAYGRYLAGRVRDLRRKLITAIAQLTGRKPEDLEESWVP